MSPEARLKPWDSYMFFTRKLLKMYHIERLPLDEVALLKNMATSSTEQLDAFFKWISKKDIQLDYIVAIRDHEDRVTLALLIDSGPDPELFMAIATYIVERQEF